MRIMLDCLFLLVFLHFRGKFGHYFTYSVDDIPASYHFAYIGCRVENSKSRIMEVPLDNPLIVPDPPKHAPSPCTPSHRCLILLDVVRAKLKQRSRPERVGSLFSPL